jgi:hypothetical protein
MTEEDIVIDVLRTFAQEQTYRVQFATQWEEVSELILPTFRNTFYAGTFNFPGEKKTARQVDSTGALALSRFAAICDSLLTPRNMFWHYLQADVDYVMKDRDSRLWMEAATRILFKERYTPRANFSSQNQNIFQSLGAFGNGFMWIDGYLGIDGSQGLRYSARPLGEMYFLENFQGQVNGFVRHFRLNPIQARDMARKMDWTLPKQIEEATDNNATFDFLHKVCPREGYDPERRDSKSKPYASYYVAMMGHKLLSEGGFSTFPGAATRYEQAPNEKYGRSPAMMILPALKTLNAQKRDFLTQGHRAASPVLLTTDDGVVDFSMRPGALNKGGMSPEGRPLVGMMPTGNIQVTKEMMDVEGGLVNDAFLVSLFQIMVESPQMTATEVIERTNEKGILLAPTVGRQMSEYLGPMIERELDVLASQRKLPPMPGLLREAGGTYDVIYTSPLARMMRAQEVAGFGRTLEMALTITNATGDPSVLDEFNLATAVRETANIHAVPESWMASEEEKAAKQQARADQLRAQMETQAAPAAAALMKAQAAQKKAGMEPAQGA